VALNTGLYWPRRSFLRRPGTAVIEFLEPLPPGLPREVFFEETRSRIEQACQRLLEETAPGSGVVAQPPAALAEPASERRA
jgi:1-acyl-sn-glycerol-3-phosphate acyltransferase